MLRRPAQGCGVCEDTRESLTWWKGGALEFPVHIRPQNVTSNDRGKRHTTVSLIVGKCNRQVRRRRIQLTP